MTEPATDQVDLLDITEAAGYTRQSAPALRAAVRNGQLRHIRRGYGGKLWFKREWLTSWLDSLEATGAAS